MKKTFLILLSIVFTRIIFAETKYELLILPARSGGGGNSALVKKIEKRLSSDLKDIDFFKITDEQLPKELQDRIAVTEFNDRNCNDIFKNIKSHYVLYSSVKMEKSSGYELLYIDLKIYSRIYKRVNFSLSYATGGSSQEDIINKIFSYLIKSIVSEKEKIIHANSDRIAFMTGEEYSGKKNSEYYSGKSIYTIKKKETNDPNTKVPDIKLTDMNTGKNFSLRDFQGKVTVVGIFNSKYNFTWELRLLERLGKMFPDNVRTAVGFLDKNENEIKIFCRENKISFPVFDAKEMYLNWPENFRINQANGKDKTVYHSEFENINFIIDQEGYIGGTLKENFYLMHGLSVRQNIEYIIRPYFKNNLSVITADFPLTLCEAAEHNDTDLLKTMIGNKDEINLSEAGFTPLFYALEYNNMEMAKLLIDNNADCNGTAGSGATPLYIAAENNNIEMVKILLAGRADITGSGKFYSPMISAVRNNNIDMLKILIGSGSINDRKKFSSLCADALDTALEKGNKEAMKLLIGNISGGRNKINIFTAALFRSSVSDDFFDISKYLIDNGADLFDQTYKGGTAYSIAKANKAVKTLAYLTQKIDGPAKTGSDLTVLAKDNLTYREILAKGIKPKLPPDYKFPCSQQGRYDCWGFALKHLIQYKYNETLDVDRFNKEYGESWISFNEEKFTELNGFEEINCGGDNRFFYLLATGEPVILNYRFYYRDGSSILHYGVAYSFDDKGVWISDSAGAKRWLMSYEKMYSDDGASYVCGIIKKEK